MKAIYTARTNKTPLAQDRYSRQTLLPEIGKSGQKRLAGARAVVIGCGALGTHTVSFLVRAGVGEVHVIDRDIVDITNLQRQTMFDELDVGRAKAKVAQERAARINSEVTAIGTVAEINATTVEGLIEGADVVIDATDNMETRFIVNDACVKHAIPWVYGGAVGVSGMVLAVVPEGPCLRCVFRSLPEPGELPTCDTSGIVNTLPAAVSALQATEAFKILTGKKPNPELLVLDIWAPDVQKVKVRKDPACPSCGKKDFEYLVPKSGKLATTLCGRNSVQVTPAKARKGDLGEVKKRLGKLGRVTSVDGVLKFRAQDADLTVFPDGRTIVTDTSDPVRAKNLYSKYIGD